MHSLWSAPLQIIVSLSLLYLQLGWSTFAGLCMYMYVCMCDYHDTVVLVLTIPMQGFVTNIMSKQRKSCVGVSDQRVKATNEVLQGIKIVKLYAWEQPMTDRVQVGTWCFCMRSRTFENLR